MRKKKVTLQLLVKKEKTVIIKPRRKSMYHILSRSRRNIIGIQIEGWIRPKDCETLFPFIEDVIHEHGNVRILSDLRNFEGFTPLGILKSFPFTLKYSSKVEKEAVVTNKKWIYIWVKLLGIFFKIDVRSFPTTKAEEAWDWVGK